MNKVLFLITIAAGVFILDRKKNENPAMEGYRQTTVENALKTIFKKPNGRERSINDAIFFGVGEKPYAWSDLAKKAGLTNFDGAFKKLTKNEAKILLSWLEENEGELYYT